MFSGSEATDDSCSQQSNSTVLQAYAAACTSRQLQPLPSSGGYLLDTGTGPISPVKPSCLALPQALQLPQPPHVLTSFGALSLSSGENWGAAGSCLTCRKVNVVRRSRSLQATHGGTELVRRVAPMHWQVWEWPQLQNPAVCYEFPDFRVFQVARFILPQQKQNILPSNQGKERRACSWVSGKCRYADGRLGEELCIKHLLDRHPHLRISVLLWNTACKRHMGLVCTALKITFPLSVLQS